MASIESGIPQRVFDIMSAGGFVLSNDQPEIRELFSPDREVVLFSSIEELKEKAVFYLKHKDIRRKIAEKGYSAVSGKYSTTEALKKMFTTVKKEFGI